MMTDHFPCHIPAIEISALLVTSYSALEAWLKYHIPQTKMSRSPEVYYKVF
jgi:hypothetical protein